MTPTTTPPAASDAIDRSGVGETTSATAAATLSLATTQAEDFVFACLGVNEPNTAMNNGTWTNSFVNNARVATTLSGGAAGNNASATSAYLTAGATSAYSTGRALLASKPWGEVLVAYKGALANSTSTTSTCDASGACSAAGALNYSAGKLNWCDGAVWRQLNTY